jgi:thiamine-monophosphate kinase
MGEFELIEKYMRRQAKAGQPHRVRVPIGDDCAILTPQTGFEGCFTTDMLVQGQHFLDDVDPGALGHKALAVNLSDLAAVGAMPGICMLSLGLPRSDESWLQAFMDGFFTLADAYDCVLIGGDTTRAPLTVINVMAGGLTHIGQGILRSGARPGQDIWVSGTLGDAALGLAVLRGKAQALPEHASACIERLQRPMPRVRLGLALHGIATSLIDLSDGLAGDLMHILRASGVAAQVESRHVPMAPALQVLPHDLALRYALAGGDDYELLFTADREQRDVITRLQDRLELSLTRIGQITLGSPHVQWLRDGVPLEHDFAGFDHFAR